MEKLTCVLFDMDGVMLDTEIQYDLFWGEVGKNTIRIFLIFLNQ